MPSLRKNKSQPVQSYCHSGRPGCVEVFKSHRLRVIVSFWRNDQAGLPTRDCEWTVRCETHGQSATFGSFSYARARGADSSGWCSKCEVLANQKGRLK